MNPMSRPTPRAAPRTELVLRRPTLSDGADLWRLARDSGSLDLNSPYAYLLWAEHFAATSVVADVRGRPAGFVLGFRSPEREHVLFVWQVAVGAELRGRGVASRMLDDLFARDPGTTAVEATVTPDNAASRRLFEAFGRRHGLRCDVAPHLSVEHFPVADHGAEDLFHIAPIETPS